MDSPDKGRRRQVRVRVHSLTLLFRREGLLQVILFFRNPDKKASVIDCSEGGMQIVVAEAIERNTPITLKMQPAFLSILMTLKGKVAYCHAHTSAKGHTFYQLGVALAKPTRDYLMMVKRLRDDPMLRQGAL